MADIFYNMKCTVWNKAVSGTWQEETWFPTVIDAVRILETKGTNIQKSGNQQADAVRLHISDLFSKPDKPYATPEEWIPGETYTLNDQTFFSKGDTSAITPDKDFFARSDVFHISSVDRFEIIPHFEIWGR